MLRQSTPADKIAFSLLQGLTPQIAREVTLRFGTIAEFMHADLSQADLPTSGMLTLMVSDRRKALERGEQEAEFAAAHGIQVLYLEDADYPQLLAECHDAPLVLYKLGAADLNAERMIGMVGTRRLSAYGLSYCKKLVDGLHEVSDPVTVVSGLAHGVDAACHQEALECGMPTIGVLAHGLHMIYPAAHKELARRIVKSGGALLTEYMQGNRPYREHFLARNRIVAGMTRGTLVVESPLRGGALNTAAHARSYSRDVMALPGRASDEASAGCNHLIRNDLAVLVTDAREICQTLRWPINEPRQEQPSAKLPSVDQLLDTAEKRKVYECLKASVDPVPFDEIVRTTGLNASQVLSSLGLMEFDALITRHPGNRFSPA